MKTKEKINAEIVKAWEFATTISTGVLVYVGVMATLQAFGAVRYALALATSVVAVRAIAKLYGMHTR